MKDCVLVNGAISLVTAVIFAAASYAVVPSARLAAVVFCAVFIGVFLVLCVFQGANEEEE